jgi:hypothetical protein
MSSTRITTLLTLLLLATACGERGSEAAPTGPEADLTPTDPALAVSPETRRLEGVARRLALALHDPAFRARFRARLFASPFREQKIHLQRTLAQANGLERREMARLAGEADAQVDSVLRATQDLEVYLPVPGHRDAWRGDAQVLVATQANDGEVPVAYDLQGRRHLLDRDRPPSTPVIAVVPVETNFDRPPTPRGNVTCITCDTGGTGPGTAGIYMTKAKFFDDFEGWLKGDPEFEIHIMGQLGTSDSLTDYACAGEHAPGLYNWDGGTDWTGQVLLFSRNQIDAYQAAHPGEAFRIVAVEDDDTSCDIRVGQDRWGQFVAAIGPLYKDMTGAKDDGSLPKWLKAGKSLKDFITAVGNLIKTNDELIGTAIEARITGESRAGFNWVLKGDGAKTNGWLNLVLQ